MNEYTGWLLDMYMDAGRGVVLWFVCDDGKRRCLHQNFPVTFYAAGPAHRLHELCLYLKRELPSIRLSRDERRDLFFGPTVVLAAQLDSPFVLAGRYRRIAEVFPDIVLYDVDLEISLRHAAVYGTFPLARCQVAADDEKNICELNVLDSRWDIDPEPPPLRILKMEPDVHPFHAAPQKILVHTRKATLRLDIHDPASLALFNYILKQEDPDLLLSSHGDTWILPLLLDWAEKEGRGLPLNRDLHGQITYKKERSYFAYGQVVYRSQQVRLAGRLHVDRGDMVMGEDYGFEGVLELARASSLPIQTAARVSPGTGISSMEAITALQQGILVPLLKEQIENEKTTSELMEAEKGGIIGDPEIGLHENVAELDFAAMYGSLVVRFNISPETVNTGRPTEELIPGLGIAVEQQKPGLIPMTLAPLLAKRAELKRQLRTLSRLDCRYEPYKSRASAHKWLVVTCIGYLGFKSARFGCITTHEVILARSRDVMLWAQEAVEDLGYQVLHRYVDGIWIKKPGCTTPQDFQPAIDEIIKRTGLSINLEGVYNWIAFPHSRKSERVAVPNRYFGVFRDGEIKTRGIETRRHDSPDYISEMQMEILKILARAPSLDHFAEHLPEIENLVQGKLADLCSGRVPPEKLIVNLSVSREIEAFKTPSPVASALRQLAAVGKTLQPGQRIRLVYILGKDRARAWDISAPFDPRTLNLPRYRVLFLRAVDTVLEPVKEYFATAQGPMPKVFEKQPVLAGLESWMRN